MYYSRKLSAGSVRPALRGRGFASRRLFIRTGWRVGQPGWRSEPESQRERGGRGREAYCDTLVFELEDAYPGHPAGSFCCTIIREKETIVLMYAIILIRAYSRIRVCDETELLTNTLSLVDECRTQRTQRLARPLRGSHCLN